LQLLNDEVEVARAVAVHGTTGGSQHIDLLGDNAKLTVCPHVVLEIGRGVLQRDSVLLEERMNFEPGFETKQASHLALREGPGSVTLYR
jgi:hypothetical protein